MKNLEINFDEEHILMNALNHYWHDANDNLKRNDLGDIERKQYQIALDKAKALMIKIASLYNSNTLNWKDASTNTPITPNKQMLVKTAGRHWEYSFGYLSVDGWKDFDTEEPINVSQFAEL